jgi:hypothetical protein
MPFLIDGHNLIPKLGLQLKSLDDEDALILRLQEFCRQRHAQVEVYFDGAPPGVPTVRKAGSVTAHFVRQGSSADAAIEFRLARLGKQARNWTIVSSDLRVQAAARAVHAEVLSSEIFAGRMVSSGLPVGPSKRENMLSPEEVDDWLNIFKAKKG